MSVLLIAQLVKNPPAMWETPVRFLGQEDSLEKEMATHFCILAFCILAMDIGAGKLQSTGLQESDTT